MSFKLQTLSIFIKTNLCISYLWICLLLSYSLPRALGMWRFFCSLKMFATELSSHGIHTGSPLLFHRVNVRIQGCILLRKDTRIQGSPPKEDHLEHAQKQPQHTALPAVKPVNASGPDVWAYVSEDSSPCRSQCHRQDIQEESHVGDEDEVGIRHLDFEGAHGLASWRVQTVCFI